jgi:ABC-type sugar transport system substrate-binding protein
VGPQQPHLPGRLSRRRNQASPRRPQIRALPRRPGLVLPDSGNPFFAEMGRAIERAAFEAGFSVILGNTENDRGRERLCLAVPATT